MANPVQGGQAPPEVLSSEIEAALRSLADKLHALMHESGPDDTGAIGGDTVLVDVEIGEVRLLALRKGRPSPMSLLSPREQEIARMVAQGYANKTIASVLEISSWTVASHLRRVFVKLQISSRAAMATCLLGSEFNALPTLLVDAVDDDITSGPRSAQETSLHPVPRSGIPVPHGSAGRQLSSAKKRDTLTGLHPPPSTPARPSIEDRRSAFTDCGPAGAEEVRAPI